MSRRLALMLACCAVGSIAVPAQQQPLFRAATDVVAVDAIVMRGRNVVSGLGPEDFRITDNGVPQVIDGVTEGTMPLDLTVVLDFSNSVKQDFDEFVQAAAGIQRLLGPDDRWRWLGVFMEARELLPMRPATDPLPTFSRPGEVGASALIDTLFLALVRPGEPARRHLVIVFSDGDDSWSILDPRRLPSIAERADAVLYAVLVGTPPPQQSESLFARWSASRYRASRDGLLEAVRISGGSTQRMSNRAEAFANIIREWRSAYVLRYTPRGVDAPGWHTLGVSVPESRGVTIRARRGYERR